MNMLNNLKHIIKFYHKHISLLELMEKDSRILQIYIIMKNLMILKVYKL